MFLIQSLLLALALCVDSLVVSATGTLKSKMSVRRGILMAFVFALFQGGFPLMGAILGLAFKDMVSAIDHWIAFGLLLFVGGKMIVDTLRDTPEEKQLDIAKVGVMCLLGIATSIDAFVVGIGLGLDYTLGQTLFIVAVIGVVTFFSALLGYYLGKHDYPIPERIAGVLAGLVLIGLGTYTLIEHLTVG